MAGSTLDGEEAALLDAWPSMLEADPQLAMVLAPRHPERFAAVGFAARKVRASVEQALRMAVTCPQPPLLPGQIVLLDTIGELASVYSLAAVGLCRRQPGTGRRPQSA